MILIPLSPKMLLFNLKNIIKCIHTLLSLLSYTDTLSSARELGGQHCPLIALSLGTVLWTESESQAESSVL